MKLLVMFITTFGVLAIAPFVASAQPSTTFRDSRGRQTGTAATNSSGVTTFRDSMGRQTGTATSNSSGVTTFRDSMGRQTGTSTRR